jgi:hypothetical protein
LSTSINERNYDRIPVQNKVKVLGKGRLALYAIAINLSLGGVLLNATPSLPVGSRCAVTLFDGAQSVNAIGTVVRSDGQGTAIQFAKLLATDKLQALAAHGGPIRNALVDAYLTYFQVGRNENNAGCETLLGVSRKTFKTVFYTTFTASIPLAIAPVWFFRAAIQGFPAWEKILACFLYGTLWYLLIQPTMDLTIFHFLRKRKQV